MLVGNKKVRVILRLWHDIPRHFLRIMQTSYHIAQSGHRKCSFTTGTSQAGLLISVLAYKQ